MNVVLTAMADYTPSRSSTNHPYLYWIQKSPRRRQALLLEPLPKEPDTPEHFYHSEMLFRSSLEHRARVRGYVFERKS